MSEEQQITKGFNAGYLIAKYKPELSQIMQTGFVDKKNPYALGFIAGAQEYQKEVSKPRSRNYVPKQLPKGRISPERGKDSRDK